MVNDKEIAMENELPGMLALAEGVAKQQWPHTMDAQVWAKQWAESLAEHPEIATDEGSMIGWFANAIMAGYDTAIQRKHEESMTQCTPRDTKQ